MLSMSTNNLSYNDQGGSDSAVEVGQETTPTSSNAGAGFGLFSTNFKKNDDLKEMLESNKDSLKLDAMKRIIALIAKGKNASELFPAVVKNVASKNIELKKLVYVYLVRYAEEQQDLALLSISTFQRALKDPNQLIRASALRVLSSIRVPIIVPIMMLAIKEAASDMSPYVRKTSAHAIQKLYSLDPDQKEHLIEVIDKLLKDKSTLVAGSVVMAFEEVCPDRIDLIHKNYRKLCNLLVDVEEWGQVVIITMLTRYARTQFTSPWKEDGLFDENSETAFYESDEKKTKNGDEKKSYVMDPDHRLLLRNTKPLLQSRNTAVVVSVAQLYWHLAPKHEVGVITKSLVRLLRSHREVQYVVLQNIATMSIQRKGMFEPYMKSFYVRSTDATHIKSLKLEILTSLANEANISTILREFQTYVKSQDKQFAAGTIQAIGRCATNISEVTDTCLQGLVLLLSNRDETVVAESVVVIKKLLQTQPTQHSDIIKHMAKLFDNIAVPMARASILWLMGEYCERVPQIAPDVLRKMAKSFTSEEDIVKLQTVNLAAKLYLTNSKQTKLLTQYILNLGKYDQNYDIRDRTRFIRQLIVPNEKSGALGKYARRILLAPKPAPVLESTYKDRDRYQLGTLSHTINTKASGYLELSDWPAVAPDQSVRNVEVIEPVKEWAPSPGKTGKSKLSKSSDDKFYSDSGEEKGSGSSSSDDSSSSSEESSSEAESDEEKSSEESDKSSSQSEKSSSESDSEQKKTTKKPPQKKTVKPTAKDSDSDENGNVATETSSSSAEETSSGSDADSHSGTEHKKKTKSKAKLKMEVKSTKEVSLLDLDDFTPTPVTRPKTSVLSPSLLGDLEGLSLSNNSSTIQVSCPAFVPEKSHDLLHRMTGKGLSAQYQFPRQPCLYQPTMVSVQISLTNTTDHPLEQIHVGDRGPTGLDMHCFNTIGGLDNIIHCFNTVGGLDNIIHCFNSVGWLDNIMYCFNTVGGLDNIMYCFNTVGGLDNIIHCFNTVGGLDNIMYCFNTVGGLDNIMHCFNTVGGLDNIMHCFNTVGGLDNIIHCFNTVGGLDNIIHCFNTVGGLDNIIHCFNTVGGLDNIMHCFNTVGGLDNIIHCFNTVGGLDNIIHCFNTVGGLDNVIHCFNTVGGLDNVMHCFNTVGGLAPFCHVVYVDTCSSNIFHNQWH
ncbi:AP-3 complex subunit beta-1-like isoform X5 [Oncorhynchus keta]|uniref:AP-3 complex subunit beta-1-like isoform X2 n=1 Tax=Oncorhynchus keta TaxID=8018 RepID=UPI00227CB4F6|nr:AP-3 complex subunit beta-1-like isoform X2 [Oncorhynchus keta]XP_052377397.1 AP-3 complex subunit beta-1-like isoform X5 [Oncorhynchus keta]